MSEELARRLIQEIGSGPVAVAASGGVDSTVLLAAAVRACGGRALAVTARSPGQRGRDLRWAAQAARAIGARHLVVDTAEHLLPEYRDNRPDRCYVCKRHLLELLSQAASSEGLTRLVEGTTSDDLAGHRPGLKAVRELGIRSPLAEAGLGKAEVRELARWWRLPGADRPSSGCLATRVAAGQPITPELLHRVDEVEEQLEGLGLGLSGPLRARVHGDLLRLELEGPDCQRAWDLRDRVAAAGAAAGFRYVTIDCTGYRTGSQDGQSGRGRVGGHPTVG